MYGQLPKIKHPDSRKILQHAAILRSAAKCKATEKVHANENISNRSGNVCTQMFLLQRRERCWLDDQNYVKVTCNNVYNFLTFPAPLPHVVLLNIEWTNENISYIRCKLNFKQNSLYFLKRFYFIIQFINKLLHKKNTELNALYIIRIAIIKSL